MKNPCQNCEKNIDLSDIKSVEKTLGYSFPEAFVSHYLSFNGGVPLR
ncbi:SMI1/KNR4 family protein, partial [Yersinia pestis]